MRQSRNETFTPAQRITLILASGTILACFLRVADQLVSATPTNSLTLYAASRVLHGDGLYTQVWYDRFPGAILFNMAALAVNHSLLSVILFEFVVIGAAAWLLRSAMLSIGAGRVESVVGGLFFAFSAVALTTIGGAGQPAEWSVVALAGFAFFLARSLISDGGVDSFLCGSMAGASFLISPREAFLLIPGLSVLRKRTIPFTAGFVLIPAVFVFILIITGNYDGFNYSVIEYNLAILKNGGWRASFIGGAPAALAAVGLLLPLSLFLIYRPVADQEDDLKRITAPRKRFLQAVAVWAVCEAAALACCGSIEPTSLIPLALPLIALWTFRVELCLPDGRSGRDATLATALFFISFLVLSAHAARQPLPSTRCVTDEKNPQRARIIRELVRIRVKPGEPMLVWSKSAATYFLSERAASSRFSSITPLFTPGYAARAGEKFIEDVARREPDVLILESSLLPESVAEHLSDVPHARVGPERKPLFDFMTLLVRAGFSVSTVRGGVIFCTRKSQPDEKESPK